MPPSALRRPHAARPPTRLAPPEGLLRLTLGYRAPLAWDALLACLAHDAIAGVDLVEGRRYGRTVSIDGRQGVVFAEDSVNGVAAANLEQERTPGSAHLHVDISLSLVPVLMPLLARLRHLFDLDAEPAVVDAHLSREGLGAMVRERPGIRIPGALDGFEVALRALLGGWPDTQTIHDAVARRVVATLGDAIECSEPGLDRLFPTPERVVDAGPEHLVALGVPRRRATQMIAVAQSVADGRLRLEWGANPAELVRALLAIDGISEALATTIVMRASSWPDALPVSHSASPLATSAGVDRGIISRAERWRPWSAYAAMHLWAASTEHRAPAASTVESNTVWRPAPARAHVNGGATGAPPV
jgi:AraC family transcriptional regulator of adaptative response / DNA-3-methyladenine glycosylase II